MLTESEITDVWEGQLAAETRSLYFGDFANRYSQQKQWITGVSFFLSSGAAATLIAKIPSWVPITCSVIVAVITAYSVAVNLDSRIRTMAKLHYGWTVIGNDYGRLWNHTYSADASSELEDIKRRELELSELATTDAPHDVKRLSHWQDQVFKMHKLESA